MTRWKLTIGALGLGLGGLAAVAAGPGQGGVSCRPHTVKKEPPAAPPVDIPTPKPAELPVFPVATAPVPPSVPVGEPSRLTVPAPLPDAPLVQSIGGPSLLKSPPQVDSPALPPAPLLAAPAAGAKSPDLPVPALPPAAELPKPTHAKLHTGETIALPATPPPPLLSAAPADLPPPASKPADVDRIPAMPVPEPARPAPAAAVESARPAPAAPPAVADKKLKVMLHMGDDRPRFEVRDGDEVYLKVTSSQVDVKAPGDGGASLSTMKASGLVRFVTPGGEGTCDELAVVPGTGLVTVTGRVAFTTNWGKTETTVTGEKMTFRLGAPGAAGGAAPVEVARTR